MPGNFHSIPKSVLNSWPKPNYVDPVRRSWFPALACSFMAASTVLVWGRVYLRVRGQAGDFGFDDAFILIGWLFAIGLTTIGCIDTTWYGLDVHTWDVHPQDYVGAARVGWIAQIVFIISTCATKISVLLFYRRMAKDAYTRKWLYAIWVALAVTTGYMIGMLVTYGLICQPLDAYWLSYDYHYHEKFKCIDGDVLSPLSGALSAFSDVYAVLLPCIMLRHYNLNVPRRQKVALNIIFALGLVVAGCGVARTYYMWKINHTFDTSWTGFSLFVWSILECQLAIICACAPSLRVFFRRYLTDPFSRSFRSGSYNRSKTLTTPSMSQELSTMCNSPFPDDAKNQNNIEQHVVTQPSRNDADDIDQDDESRIDKPYASWSTHSSSSEAIAPARAADRHDAFVMRSLNSANTTPPLDHLSADQDEFDANRLSGFDCWNPIDTGSMHRHDADNVV